MRSTPMIAAGAAVAAVAGSPRVASVAASMARNTPTSNVPCCSAMTILAEPASQSTMAITIDAPGRGGVAVDLHATGR